MRRRQLPHPAASTYGSLPFQLRSLKNSRKAWRGLLRRPLRERVEDARARDRARRELLVPVADGGVVGRAGVRIAIEHTGVQRAAVLLCQIEGVQTVGGVVADRRE